MPYACANIFYINYQEIPRTSSKQVATGYTLSD